VPPILPSFLSSTPTTTEIVALETDAELDDYTYRVAGCVGEFWTKLTRAHLFPEARIDEDRFLADGVRFGQGLQLVNILRDLPKDLRAGRCYLPSRRLTEAGLKPEDLLDPANYPRLRLLYAELLDRAQAHLEAGWRYTNTLPRGQIRLRLACAWPVLLGAKTITTLCSANVLDARRRVKVSRSEVEWLLVTSTLRAPFRGAWERQFATCGG
jgi:farnesyl-diphosphate farnesyltransferase